MKKHLLIASASLALLLGSAADGYAQTDMTGRITNPSFENGSTGWTVVGMAMQTNTTFALKKGTTYAEKWVSKGNGAGDASLMQTLHDMPAGTYTLTAQAQNIQQDTPTEVQGGVSLVAGTECTAVGVTDEYSVTATLDNGGELAIGFVLKGATGNYICVDDFRLTLVSCSAEQVQGMLSAAQELAGQKMNSTVQAALDAAIAAASEGTSTDVAVALSDAILAATASVADYSALRAALDEAEAYHATAPANGADELKEVMDKCRALYDSGEADTESAAAAVKALAAAVITCRVANSTGREPVVTSLHFMPTGSTAALGRMSATGSGISERGYVWATHPNPTVADNRSTVKYSHNGDIYELSPLEPSTEYYVRPYAMTKGYAVGYGEEQRIFTLPKASVTWDYDNAGDAETNERISGAVKDAVDLYNIWTNIRGFNLSVHYVPGAGAGGGTADCSYGGWMRVSQNTAYQRTGTILHEASHGNGVIPWNTTRWTDSNMRSNGDRGDWLGWRATQMVRFFMNTDTDVLHGDNQHLWPYGINGANEDHGSQIEYIANVLIVHAVHEDGVHPVSGQGASAAYTFEHNDATKYYITNADEAHGTGTAFLYETATGALKWAEAKDTTLAADDAYAWHFEYIPEKAYYRIRNAATGKYFTYSGSTIKTAAKANPGNSECFQLMVGYSEVKAGEDKTVSKHPYYIMAGSGDFAPLTLNAASKGATNATALSLNAASAVTQRWLILSEDEAMRIGSARIEEHTGHLQEVINATKTMLALPSLDQKEGASDAMQAAVDDAEAKLPSLTTIPDVKSTVAALKRDIRNYIEACYPADIHQPFDLTCLIEDRAFASDEYWTGNNQATPVVADGVASVEGAKFKFTQTIADMPKGVFQLRAQAYQTVEPTSYIFINSTVYKGMAQPVGSVSEEEAAVRFAEGEYETYATTKRASRGNLQIGITNLKAEEGDKTVFGNFRLYYYGNNVSRDEVDTETGVAPAVAERGKPAGIYDLSGRRIGTPKQGIYICNGRKIVIR